MVGQLRLTSGAFFARDFEVQQVLAEGGMGTVYLVVDHTCGEQRALKVLLPELVTDQSSRRRFAQESQIAAQLQSPHVPRIYRVGVDDVTSMPWISMELLRGRDLRRHVRERGALPVGEAWPILAQLGEALVAAHRIGLIHRDVKPENVFLHTVGDTFEVKLLDFGVAKVLDLHRMSGTGTGAIGSPLWMAPEQTMTGGRIVPATDVFAFALVSFFTLVGRIYWRAAHDETGVTGLMREIHVDDHVSASARARELAPEVKLPWRFDAFFERALRRNPSERFPDAQETLASLREAIAPRGRAAHRANFAFAPTVEAELSTRAEVPPELISTTTAPMGGDDIPPTDPPPPMPAEQQPFVPSLPQPSPMPAMQLGQPSPMPAMQLGQPSPMPGVQPSMPGLPQPSAPVLYPSAPQRGWLFVLGLLSAGFLAAIVGGALVWIGLTLADRPARRRAVPAPHPAPVAPTPAPTPALSQLHIYLAAEQRWSGTYVCDARVTNATLHIRSVYGRDVEAEMTSALPGESPTYLRLSGEYRSDTQQLILRAPAGSPNSFDGHIEEEGMAFRGTLHPGNCSSFSFRRDPS